jgi:hypothetical protein
MAQVGEHLPSKFKALSSNSSTTKKEKKVNFTKALAMLFFRLQNEKTVKSPSVFLVMASDNNRRLWQI